VSHGVRLSPSGQFLKQLMCVCILFAAENEESENDEEVTSSEENSLMYTTADGENAAVEAASEPVAAEEHPFSVITPASHPQNANEDVQAVDKNSVAEPTVVPDAEPATIAPAVEPAAVVPAAEPTVVHEDIAPAKIPSEPPPPVETIDDSSSDSSDSAPEQSQGVVAEESPPQPSPSPSPEPQQQQLEPEPLYEASEETPTDDSELKPENEPEKMDYEESNAVQSYATHADTAQYERSERFESYGEAVANNVEEASQSYSSEIAALEDDSRGPTREINKSNDNSKTGFEENMESQDEVSSSIRSSSISTSDSATLSSLLT